MDEIVEEPDIQPSEVLRVIVLIRRSPKRFEHHQKMPTKVGRRVRSAGGVGTTKTIAIAATARTTLFSFLKH